MNQLLKPWDVRPQPLIGEREPQALFVAVGEALTEWENVETSLAKLFAVLVSARGKSTFWLPAVQAYGSIASFKNRCDMIRVAGDAHFSTRQKIADKGGPFSKLIGEAGQYAARRNEIAHGKVSEVFWYDARKKSKSGGFYLLPSLFNPRKVKKSGIAYAYVSADLLHYKQEFSKLHLRIEGFRFELTRRSSRGTR
jgi:hypothetical protein